MDHSQIQAAQYRAFVAEGPGGRHMSKHMRRWQITREDQRTGKVEVRDALTPQASHSGRRTSAPQGPVEAKSTARRPWTVRDENRARNRRARAARKRSATVGKRGGSSSGRRSGKSPRRARRS